jgi:hypothetical protein
MWYSGNDNIRRTDKTYNVIIKIKMGVQPKEYLHHQSKYDATKSMMSLMLKHTYKKIVGYPFKCPMIISWPRF